MENNRGMLALAYSFSGLPDEEITTRLGITQDQMDQIRLDIGSSAWLQKEAVEHLISTLPMGSIDPEAIPVYIELRRPPQQEFEGEFEGEFDNFYDDDYYISFHKGPIISLDEIQAIMASCTSGESCD